MTTTRRKRRTTSGFRAYCCRDEEIPTQGAARRAYVATIVDGVLNLLTLAQDKVGQTVELLAVGPTRAHLEAGRPIPKAIRTRIEDAHNKVNSAFACFESGGVKDDIDDTKASYGMTIVRDQAQNAYTALDEDSAFSLKREPVTFASTLVATLDELSTTLEKAHMLLVPYAQAATHATLPQAPALASRPSPAVVEAKRAVDEKAARAQQELAPFLEQLRSRGWKTQDPKPPPKHAPLFGLDDEEEFDGFEQGANLIHTLQRSSTELLPPDELMGVVKFPVISLNKKRIPESLIQFCTDPRIGYSVYIVFGGYMVVDNMCLLGIHKSLMWMQGDKGVELDLDKFQHLVPYVKNHYPQWTEPLNLMYPVQPARVVGDHCYCPLLPMNVLKSWGNGIGAWELLNS